VVDAGFQVHQALGPGLLESAYEECLAYELTERGIAHRRQVGMPLFYKGLKLDVGYRIDLLVASCVVVEVKAIDTPLPIHVAQVITYLKLSDCRVGLLMNFNTKLFKTGVRRIAL
jgi:GxxExxY protein